MAQDLAVVFLTVSGKLLEVGVYGSVQKVGLGSGFREGQRNPETELVMETVVKEAVYWALQVFLEMPTFG